MAATRSASGVQADPRYKLLNDAFDELHECTKRFFGALVGRERQLGYAAASAIKWENLDRAELGALACLNAAPDYCRLFLIDSMHNSAFNNGNQNWERHADQPRF